MPTKKHFKILALDLDGTLTNKKKEITPHTYDILLRAQKEKGIKIVLASGRPVFGIAHLADKLQLDRYGGYVLAYNGGKIIRWDTKGVIYSRVLNPEIYPFLYKHTAKQNFIIFTYVGEYIISEDTGDPYVQHAAFINKMTGMTVPHFLDSVTFPVPKCIIAGNPIPLEQLEINLKKEFNNAELPTLNGEPPFNLFRSEPFFLEIVPPYVDKARSLEHLLKTAGIQKEQLMAIGDGWNDISMIRLAELGIAMDNAQESLRNHADYITLSNEEDGVAAAVEKFILNT